MYDYDTKSETALGVGRAAADEAEVMGHIGAGSKIP